MAGFLSPSLDAVNVHTARTRRVRYRATAMTGDKRRGPRTLATDEADRVRAAIAKMLESASSQRDLARRLGCSGQAVSRVLLGEAPGQTLARQVAEALDIPLERLLRGGELDLSEPPTKRFGSLPGWAEAEAAARVRYRHVPDEAWKAVANLRGPRAPDVITPEVVAQIASAFAMALAPHSEEPDPD